MTTLQTMVGNMFKQFSAKAISDSNEDITLTKEELIKWVIQKYNPAALSIGLPPIPIVNPITGLVNDEMIEVAFSKYVEHYIKNRQPIAAMRDPAAGISLLENSYFRVPTKSKNSDLIYPRVARGKKEFAVNGTNIFEAEPVTADKSRVADTGANTGFVNAKWKTVTEKGIEEATLKED